MGRLASELILSLIDKVTGPSRGISGSLNRIENQVERLNRTHRASLAPVAGFASRLLALGAGAVGVHQGFKATVGAAISFESAMADVRKVVDATDGQFAAMRQQIIDMSKQMPISAEGFASIYAAAAQSGIAQNELRGFAEAVAKVSTAWDVPVEQTGEALAKIKTALGRDVPGTMALADALNHVSNVSAAGAPDLLEYTNRVAAFAETAGFSAEQALAFGGAMVGSGFEPEVAATSFRNLTKSLAAGTNATKGQRKAMKALGIDAIATSKNMQKDAVKTTLDVFDRLKRLPAHQRISMASALFGDEARALAPLLKDATELRRLLAETGNSARYSGSAFKEYIARANTVGNTLDILKNKVADVFRQKGDEMLPGIKEAAIGIGNVLDTLGQRVNILDRLEAVIKGISTGLGYKGGIKDAVEGLGDLLFGKADGSSAADELGELFARAKGWGESLSALNKAVAESPLTGFFKEVGGYGLGLAVSAASIGIFAGAVSTLSSALYTLSGARAAIGILGALGRGGKWTASALGLLGAADAVLDEVPGKNGPRSGGPGRKPTPGVPEAKGPSKGLWSLIGGLGPQALAAGGVLFGAMEMQAQGSKIPLRPNAPNTPGDYLDRIRRRNLEGSAQAPRIAKLPDQTADQQHRIRESAVRQTFDAPPMIDVDAFDARLSAANRSVALFNDLLTEFSSLTQRATVAIPLPPQEVLQDSPIRRRTDTRAFPGKFRDDAEQARPSVPLVPRIDTAQLEQASTASERLQSLYAELSDMTLRPKVDTTSIDQAGQKATAAGQQMTGALGITATPIVNTASIDQAVNRANTLRATLSAISAAAGGVASRAPSNSLKFGGPRAKGGPVQRGVAHLVGEKGVELFVPDQSGTIVPNYALGGAARAPSVPEMRARSSQSSRAESRVPANINLGGITIYAAPGQSAEQIVDEVERRLSAKVRNASEGVFADGIF